MADRDPASLDADFVPTRARIGVHRRARRRSGAARRRRRTASTTSTTAPRCSGPASTATLPCAELAAEICEELDLPYDTVLADTVRVVQELGSEGLLDGVTMQLEDGDRDGDSEEAAP